jgi:hypothetical protein
MGGLQQGRGGWRGEGNPPRGSGAEAGPQDRFQVRLWFARGHTLTRARAPHLRRIAFAASGPSRAGCGGSDRQRCYGTARGDRDRGIA